MKNAVLYEECKKLYVIKGIGIEAIAEIFNDRVSARTIYNWRNEHKWDEARKREIDVTNTLYDQLVELCRSLLIQAKENPSPQNVYALNNTFTTLKMVENARLEQKELPAENKEQAISKDTVAKIEAEILGI